MSTLGLLAALAANPAEASESSGQSEVGTSKSFGIGVLVGRHSVTGKYFLNRDSGIGIYANPGLFGIAGHVAYEKNFWEIGDWPFASLDMYWNVGAIGGVTRIATGTTPLAGVGGGVGASMRFKSVPAEAFIHNFMYTAPTYYSYGFGYVNYYGGLGGRWYF